MAVETMTKAEQVKADEKQAKADEKALSEEEKADKKVQEENKKKQEERTKKVDETLNNLQTDEGLDMSIIKEVADRVSRTQVVAAGAEYGPTPMALEELKEQEFPLIAPPLPDGTPVANIAQVEKKEDKDAKGKVAPKTGPPK